MAKQSLSRSDDEEIRDKMDKGGLSYRAGWPTLPPMPIHTIIKGASKAVPDAYKRIQEVKAILRAQGIRNGVRGFVFRVPRDATNDLLPYLTLLCTIDVREHSNIVVDAIIEIRLLFRQHDATKNVLIEFIDRRGMDNLNSFCIGYNNGRIVERWEEVMQIVLKLLDAHKWLSLELLRRGLSEIPEECPPTIVITTPTARDPKWSQIIKPAILVEIESIADDFQVEILCGTTIFAGGSKW